MVAAAAMFAAASCAQELENNQVPSGETVTFTAVADGVDTKAALNEGTKCSEWEAGDAITVHNGTKGFEFTTEEAGSRATFSYTGNDFGGEKFLAVYPSGKSFDVANKVVKAYIPTWQQAKAGTYNHDAAVAVAYSENDLFNFKNATALLKFTVNTDNVTHVVFHGNGSEAITGDVNITLGEKGVETVQCLETEFTEDKWNEETQQNDKVTVNKYGTWVECYAWDDNSLVGDPSDDTKYFTKGQTYYIAVAPQVFNDGVTAKIRIDSGEEIQVRTTTNKVETKVNTILDLGTFEYTAPVVHEWAIAGTFNEWSTTANPMELVDGYYVAKNVTGLDDPNVSGNMVTGFKFVNNGVWKGAEDQVTAGTWAYVWSDGANIYVGGEEKSETAYDIYLNPNEGDHGKFVVVAAGTPMPEDGVVEPDQPETKTYGICGDLTAWGEEEDIPMELVDGKYVAYNVTFTSVGAFKIRANKDWVDSDNWGLSSTGAVEVGKYYEVITNGGSGNLTIIAGTYDIWFDLDNARVYILKPGASISTAVEGTPIAPSSDVWYLIGEFNGWTQADADYKFTNEAGWFVLKNCNLSKGGGVKINNGTWDVQRTGLVGLYASCALSSSGSDFYLPKGVYDIYMDTNATKIYVLSPGETPATTGSYRLYVKNSTSQDNVYIHAWGGYSTDWPGVRLTSSANVDSYGNCSYLELKKGESPIVNFLVHNGSEGNKTSDQNCSSLVILPTGDLLFEWK